MIITNYCILFIKYCIVLLYSYHVLLLIMYLYIYKYTPLVFICTSFKHCSAGSMCLPGPHSWASKGGMQEITPFNAKGFLLKVLTYCS